MPLRLPVPPESYLDFFWLSRNIIIFSDEQIQQALFNAGAIGYLAMRNATVAGAVGGCQAETGIAAAMAASAATELLGGTSKQCTYAASTVLMNMLGLVCDPVGGLVEYPCQNRNAAGVANALVAAEMALAGITQLIPLDEMINVMYTVGKNFRLNCEKLHSAAVRPHRPHVNHVICVVKQIQGKNRKEQITNLSLNPDSLLFFTYIFLYFIKSIHLISP